ncbi:MAG: NAD(P)/FAD-dependent oxidoreductase [Pseudomonadota bacterium]
MTERADVIVIGAGVVGLAVAAAIARSGRDVIVAEKHDAFGTETSSRNSEVIHAGIYYKPEGMRGRLAVKGRDALYAYCREHRVNHDRCGKLIVAFGEDEKARLGPIIKNAEQNGVDDLELVSAERAREIEPGIDCTAAIWSPSTGIVDSHGLMIALLGDLEEASGAIALSTPVVAGEVKDDGIKLQFGGNDPISLHAKSVINCAGLWSDQVARSIIGIPIETIPEIQYGKGQYFAYSGKAPFTKLIYPLPTPDSQGVHYTRDLGGQGKLGPDLSYVSSNEDYDVDAARLQQFAASARKFWPTLDETRLVPGYSGIRPKIAGPGQEGDFTILGRETHGINGYVGLHGIESPGLTTCLAIAEYVADAIA